MWVGGRMRHLRREPFRLGIVPTTGQFPCWCRDSAASARRSICSPRFCACVCPGMKLSRMPLFAWLNLVMSGMVLLAITPLSAAQIMLLIDRYLGGHFFDTQAGGSATIWMHFFWIFGHPEVYILIIPCFAISVRNCSGIFAKTDLRLSGHGRGDDLYRVREYKRVGPPHVHDRNELLREQFFRIDHDGGGRAHGNQDLQLDRHHVGRQACASIRRCCSASAFSSSF